MAPSKPNRFDAEALAWAFELSAPEPCTGRLIRSQAPLLLEARQVAAPRRRLALQ